jgi:hypothetical protein
MANAQLKKNKIKNAQLNVKFLTNRRGDQTWHYMGTSTELTTGEQTKYSGDAPYSVNSTFY